MTSDMPPGTLSADAIWLRTRSAVTSAQYPDRIEYTIAITGSDGDKPSSNHYRAIYAAADGKVRVFAVSEEEEAQPALIPRGVNVSASIAICMPVCWGYSVPVGHPQPSYDLLGVPLLAPSYMFGLRYTTLVATAMPLNVLPVIARVSTEASLYRITLIDTPEIDGTRTYHLQLTPLRNPKKDRLRELWVGAADYLPRKAVIAGNFTVAPFVDVPWTIDFSVVDGAPYIRDEYTAQVLYLRHRRVVRDAVVAFEDIHEPVTAYDAPLIAPDDSSATLVEPSAPNV